MASYVRFLQPVKNRWGNVVTVGHGEEKMPKWLRSRLGSPR